MSRPLQYKSINNTVIASSSSLITTSQPSVTNISNGMPVGDMEIYEMYLRAYGNLDITSSAAGTIVANGPENFLRSITFQTDKHGKLIDSLDGRGLYVINQYRTGTSGQRTAISAATTGTPSFETNLILPFATPSGLRPYDSILDVLKARPTLITQYGVVADFISGGTNSVLDVGNLSQELDARILNGPIVEPSAAQGAPLAETPEWMPHIEMFRYTVAASATGLRIPLPYGDRIYRRIYISQRNSSTFAEVSNIVASTANVGIEVNSFPWGDRVQNATLQAANKQNFQAETLPTGWTVLDFDETNRYADMLSVIDRNNGTANLIIDVTTQTNAQLWVYLESFKPIPDAALRDSQLALRSAA